MGGTAKLRLSSRASQSSPVCLSVLWEIHLISMYYFDLVRSKRCKISQQKWCKIYRSSIDDRACARVTSCFNLVQDHVAKSLHYIEESCRKRTPSVSPHCMEPYPSGIERLFTDIRTEGPAEAAAAAFGGGGGGKDHRLCCVTLRYSCRFTTHS